MSYTFRHDSDPDRDFAASLKAACGTALRWPMKAARRLKKRLNRAIGDRWYDFKVSAHRRRRRKTTFIGVTGSCGKTTTTALVDTVLSSAGECQHTPNSMGTNSNKCVIANLLAVGPTTKFCVQEMSGSRPGRITEQCKLLKPDIGIITTVGSDHYRNFRSLEATAAEKGAMIALLPKTGIAVLNADDPHVAAMADRTSARVLTYGTSPRADVRGTNVSSAWPDRLALTVTHGGESLRLQTKLCGEFWATSILAAIACGIACGVPLRESVKALEAAEPVFMRFSEHVAPNGAIYILDHKASFSTIAAALEFMRTARAPRRTFALGTISDYPGSASPRYRRIARDALEVADRLVFFGPNSEFVSKLQAGPAGDRLLTFATAYQASAALAKDPVPGELILVKGSLTTNHQERIVLSQIDQVVCWQEQCGEYEPCTVCEKYRTPSPPPFGLSGPNKRAQQASEPEA